MNLERVEPPPGGREAVMEALSRLLADPESASVPIMQAFDRLLLSEPHRTFGIDTDRLTSFGFQESAYPVGWRYLLADAELEDAIAAVELVQQPDGTPMVVGINEGPFVAATTRGIELAEQTESVDAAYEVRFVDIPAVSFAGLWFVGQYGDRRLLPLSRFSTQLPTDLVLPEERVVAGLMDLVDSRGQRVFSVDEQSEPEGG